MKIVRTIGLAAFAALALTALLGAGSALAVETTLCKSAAESPYCSSENRYPKETLLKGSSSNATIENNVSNISCSEASIETKTEAVAGEPQAVGVPSLSFGGCKEKLLGSKCSVKPSGVASPASLSWTDHGNGQLGGAEERFEANCSTIGLNCIYELESPFTLSSNGFSAELLAVAIQLKKVAGGLFCPATNQFSATYPLSSPGAVSVARAQAPPAPVTGFCKSLEQYCEAGSLYPKGTNFTGTSSAITIDTSSGLGNISCSESSLGITTGADYGAPLPLTSTFVLAKCKVVAGGSGCTFATSGFNGSLNRIESTTSGKWTGATVVEMNCSGLGIACQYASAEGASMTFYGGHPEGPVAKVVASNLPLTATKKGCFVPSLKISGTYTIPVANPLWVTNATY